MKKKIGAFALLLTIIALPALADTFVTVPNPQAVFDSTLGTAYSLCPPGQASACDPIADLNSTQTLTNKTLTSPTINGGAHIGPVPVACGATCTLTAANSGQTTLLNLAAGSVATLPAATGTGNVYNFVVSTTTTGAKDAILAASSSDAILGLISGENAGTGVWFAGSASTYHSIQMPFAGSQPNGGFKGDSFSCRDIATNVWECNGTFQAGTTPTTPYSSSTT
jgi:hypothetical protein